MAERVIGDNENNPAEVAGRAGVEIWPCVCLGYTKLIKKLKRVLSALLNMSRLPRLQ